MNNLKRIKNGQQAPLFTAKDYKGNKLSLENYLGEKVLLSFHVFGSCPFCNLRVKELDEKYSEFIDISKDHLAIVLLKIQEEFSRARESILGSEEV